MLEKVEYNKFACKLENDLNGRFTRIKWKVDDYDKQFKRATISREWWAAQPELGQSGTVPIEMMAPEEAFEYSMDRLHISFSLRVNEIRLTGDTEMDGRLITDPHADATSIIAEMVAGEIAAELLIE